MQLLARKLLKSPLLDALEPGIAEWVRTDIKLRTSLGMLPRLLSKKWEVRRAAERELSDTLAAEFALPPDPTVRISELTVPGTTLRIRRYRPAEVQPRYPTQLWLHGGGFTSGAPLELVNDSVLTHRVSATGLQVLALYYPLAPEHPYPAAKDAALIAARAIRAHAAELEVDPERFGTGGNSAGAAIIASAALAAGAAGERLFDHLHLEVPPGTLRFDLPEGITDPIAGPVGDQAQALIAAYLPDGADDGFASPADAVEVVGMPPTLIIGAEFDPLLPRAERLAARLQQEGVPVIFEILSGHLHASATVTARSDGAQHWQRITNEFLHSAYAASPTGSLS